MSQPIFHRLEMFLYIFAGNCVNFFTSKSFEVLRSFGMSLCNSAFQNRSKSFDDFELPVILIWSIVFFANFSQIHMRKQMRGKNVGVNASVDTILITVHRQAILLLVVESGTRKLRKVVESRTKFPFDVKRVLHSTTVLVLDSTPILLL